MPEKILHFFALIGNTAADQTETKHSSKSMKKTKQSRKYNGRVLNVEKGNFTPLVFLTSGGMSLEYN